MGLDRTGPGDNFVRDLSKQNGPLDWVKAPGQPEKAPDQPQMSQGQPEKSPDQREEPVGRSAGFVGVNVSPSRFKLKEYQLETIQDVADLTKDLIAANRADLREKVFNELSALGLTPLPPQGDKELKQEDDKDLEFANQMFSKIDKIEDEARDVLKDKLRHRVIKECKRAWGREIEWIRPTMTYPVEDYPGSA